MEFAYNSIKTVLNRLEIEALGNCCIEASTDNGEFYYLVIRTELGMTQIFKYGPAVPDLVALPKAVDCSFKRMTYTDSKIAKAIEMFLNDPYKNITDAHLVSYDEVFESCKSIVDYMASGGDIGYGY